jgi:hypothetical protein
VGNTEGQFDRRQHILLLESNVEIVPKQLVTLRPSRAVRMRVEKRADVDLIA